MEEVELLIPYFTIRDLPKKALLNMKIYINSCKFPGVKFDIRERELFVSSESYKHKKYFAKIYFPTKINAAPGNADISYTVASKHYELFLTKSEENLTTSTYCKLKNLETITKYLSWRDQSFEEDPDDLKFVKEKSNIAIDDSSVENANTSAVETSEEAVLKSLEELKLSAAGGEQLSKQFNDIKISEESKCGTYGFANKYKNMLSDFEGDWKIAIELSEPDMSVCEKRFALRWEQERQSFDVEHYFADYFLEKSDDDDDDGGNVPLLYRSIKFKPYWHCINRANEKILTSKQMIILASLPCKKFSLEKKERLEVLHSLLDIVLAYAYDYRINKGKPNTESAWNINKLSSTLSWFQVHNSVGEAVNSFFRRSLVYPLCRSWLLSSSAFADALEIFHLGRRQLLNVLVSIYELFDADDDRQILNELYIEDYLIWIQQVNPQTIENYTALMESCSGIRKQDVFSVLPDLETEAEKALKEEPIAYDEWNRNMNNLLEFIGQREINKGEDSSSSTEYSSCDSEYSSCDSEHSVN